MTLNIYFGPMYAGKTSKLMNMYRHTYENNNEPLHWYAISIGGLF